MIDRGISLHATQTLIDAIETGRKIRLEAYVLANPRLREALAAAAARGAGVEVVLCGHPFEPSPRSDLTGRNEDVAKELRAAGVVVRLDRAHGAAALHAKVATVDGKLFLDDRNWRTDPHETLIVDDRIDDPRVARTKRSALAREAALIRSARGHDVIVSTESLGPGPVAQALIDRAARGDRVRLLYDRRAASRQSPLLARLRSAGVHLRASRQAHKIAAGADRAWIGSANASPGGEPRAEWGLVVHSDLAKELRATLERAWSVAAPR